MVKELTLENPITTTTDKVTIVLFNDDFNTFDWVIKSLVDVCEHSTIQAEQCAMIVHFKGKYPVKSGAKEKLVPMCEALLDRGLSAQISQ